MQQQHDAKAEKFAEEMKKVCIHENDEVVYCLLTCLYLGFWCQCCQLSRILGQSEVYDNRTVRQTGCQFFGCFILNASDLSTGSIPSMQWDGLRFQHLHSNSVYHPKQVTFGNDTFRIKYHNFSRIWCMRSMLCLVFNVCVYRNRYYSNIMFLSI